jgi:small conductance mechanosensitive channel
LAYNSDLDKAKKVLEGAALKLAETPAMKSGLIGKPEIWGIQALAGEEVVFRMVQQVRPSKKEALTRALRAEVKTALDKAGIKLSLPDQKSRAKSK